MFSVVKNSLRLMSKHPSKISGLMASGLNRKMSSVADYNYETLKVTSPKEFVYQVELNRPEKRNAMNKAFWREMVECFNQIAKDGDCRVVVISAAGKIFTAGLDLMEAAQTMGTDDDSEVGRKAFRMRQTIQDYQESFTVIEKCSKPVIAAVHNACVGGGVDLITACDIRYCTQDAWFQIKEVDLGLAADVGTLQRLPKVVGNDSLVRELAYTARKIHSDEAKDFGLVSRVFADRDAMIASAMDTAEEIAIRSPIAVQTTKMNLVYARDHSVSESLDHIVLWNQAMLQSEDVMKAVLASVQKEKPTFSKL